MAIFPPEAELRWFMQAKLICAKKTVFMFV